MHGEVDAFLNVQGGATLQEEYPDCDCTRLQSIDFLFYSGHPSFCRQCRSF